MSTDAAAESVPKIKVTETAAEEATGLLRGEDYDTDIAGLRLFVQQGGCAGLSYGMRFDVEPEADDEIDEHP